MITPKLLEATFKKDVTSLSHRLQRILIWIHHYIRILCNPQPNYSLHTCYPHTATKQIEIKKYQAYTYFFTLTANLYSLLGRLAHLIYALHNVSCTGHFFCTVSFLLEGEPPPPRSTPWGAYRPAISGRAVPLFIIWPFCAAFAHTLTHSR